VLARRRVQSHLRAVRYRTLEPHVETHRSVLVLDAWQASQAFPEHARRVVQAAPEAESARVPVPQVDAVVIAGESAEGPVPGVLHGPFRHRRTRLAGRTRQRRRRAWLTKPSAGEERQIAFPRELAVHVHGGVQVELGALRYGTPVHHARFEVEVPVDGNASVLHQVVARLQYAPDRHREPRVRQDGHREAETERVWVQHRQGPAGGRLAGEALERRELPG